MNREGLNSLLCWGCSERHCLDDIELFLGQARLLRRHIAPFLDNWLLNLPWVSSRPSAHLLGNIHTLLGGGELGDQLGHVLAGTLGLQRTLFLGSVLDNSLSFVITFLLALLETTASWGTEFPGLLGTPGDGCVLLDILLGDRANLLGPLGALGVGGVARGLILTLLLNFSSTLNNIIFNIMNLLLGPALRLIFSSANLGSLDVAVLHKRSSADFNCLVECNLLILYKTAFPEVLLALLLLLRLVVSDIGGVAPLVIGVVTLHNIIIFSLLNHLYFVNTSLAIGPRSSSGNSSKANIGVITSLTLVTSSSMIVMFIMMSMVMVILVSVEGEGSDKGLSISLAGLAPELSCPKDTVTTDKEYDEELGIHVAYKRACRCEHEHCSTVTPH